MYILIFFFLACAILCDRAYPRYGVGGRVGILTLAAFIGLGLFFSHSLTP